MTIIVLCVMLIILFVIALAVTAFLCWVSATAFSWGIVALVWLFLLVMAGNKNPVRAGRPETRLPCGRKRGTQTATPVHRIYRVSYQTRTKRTRQGGPHGRGGNLSKPPL